MVPPFFCLLWLVFIYYYPFLGHNFLSLGWMRSYTSLYWRCTRQLFQETPLLLSRGLQVRIVIPSLVSKMVLAAEEENIELLFSFMFYRREVNFIVSADFIVSALSWHCCPLFKWQKMPYPPMAVRDPEATEGLLVTWSLVVSIEWYILSFVFAWLSGLQILSGFTKLNLTVWLKAYENGWKRWLIKIILIMLTKGKKIVKLTVLSPI